MRNPDFSAWVLILAFGILLGLALAGMMVDCGISGTINDAGCVCQ